MEQDGSAPAAAGRRFPFWLLLGSVAAILVLTMPATQYIGDAIAVRAGAFAMVKTGSPGIPYSETNALAGFLQSKGQYFFENDEKQMLFPKYGIGNTLLFLPPLLVQQAVEDPSPFLHWRDMAGRYYGRRTVLFLNLYNILAGLLIAGYLYALARLYTVRRTTMVVYVLACMFTTFLWHYLRAQASEVFQVWLFLGFHYHLVSHVRERARAGEGGRMGWGHLLASSVYGAVLTLTKLYYGIVFPIAWGYLLLAGRGECGQAAASVRKHLRQYLLFAVLPASVMTVLVAAANAYQFGSPFCSGYGQWVVNGVRNDSFGLANYPVALSGFLFGVGKNIILHFPVLAIAFFGYRRFVEKHPGEAGLQAVLFVAVMGIVCGFSNWSGDICYGPRYLLCVLPVLSLPFVAVVDWIIDQRSALRRVVPVAAVAAPLLLSMKWQVSVNSLDFFLFERVSSTFATFRIPEVNAYFSGHRAWVSEDLTAYKLGAARFYPIEEVRTRLIPGYEKNFAEFEEGVRRQVQLNYYLFGEHKPVAPLRIQFGIRLEPTDTAGGK